MDDVCLRFCCEQDLLSDLEKCLKKVSNLFSNIKNIVAEYDCFSEEEGHIVIRVDVTSDQDTAFREYDEYIAWLLDEIVDEHLNFFVLSVHRV